ncbi:MAG: hypothetical protein HKN00_05550 [Flavobacteriaceae bacterium]|nr:hypothetical protein [Bacteroidia bacterium]MBT8288155.1 hypothetical protein [Bacteroidia bacterium]NNF74627.1 hypothetical protein [Flavobacteriaceae bacterium]NNK71765.1 hypothetical protein [Flavobacteriaceae bacterium]
MKTRSYYYIALFIGAFIIIYAQNDVKSNWLLLILGFALLMTGLFGVYRGIPKDKPEYDPFSVKEEEE